MARPRAKGSGSRPALHPVRDGEIDDHAAQARLPETTSDRPCQDRPAENPLDRADHRRRRLVAVAGTVVVTDAPERISADDAGRRNQSLRHFSGSRALRSLKSRSCGSLIEQQTPRGVALPSARGCDGTLRSHPAAQEVTYPSAGRAISPGRRQRLREHMPRTAFQELGELGEKAVAALPCPRCKRSRTLRRLPVNFKCADVICDFCGYLAQVKTSRQENVDVLPHALRSAAWMPQAARMEAGIYFPLFIVLIANDRRRRAIYYLPADLQAPAMFQKRRPLSATARRAGWTGYRLLLDLPGLHQPVRVQ